MPASAGQPLDRLDEASGARSSMHEVDGVAARAAAVAEVDVPGRGDVERRGLLVVERAQPLEVAAARPTSASPSRRSRRRSSVRSRTSAMSSSLILPATGYILPRPARSASRVRGARASRGSRCQADGGRVGERGDLVDHHPQPGRVVRGGLPAAARRPGRARPGARSASAATSSVRILRCSLVPVARRPGPRIT